MSEYSDATLVDDLRELARALIEDPETGPIIKYAAAHNGRTHPWEGDQEAEYYPNAEDKVLDAFFERQPVIRRCTAPPRGTSRSANADYASFENRYVALHVAYGLVKGIYVSLDDPKLIEFIENRMMLCDDDITWGDDERFAYRDGNWDYIHFYELCLDGWICSGLDGAAREDYDRWKADIGVNGQYLEKDQYLRIQRAYNMYSYNWQRFEGGDWGTPMFFLIPAYVWDNGLTASRYQPGTQVLFEEFVALIKRERLDFGIVYDGSGWKGE